MTDNTKQDRKRDAVLAELHEMLPGATASDVTAFADTHPQYLADILAFAAEWLAFAEEAEAEMDETGPEPEASPVVLAALERFHAAAPAPAADPFVALDLTALERLATDCCIDIGILRKIEKRLIDVLTMPGKLLTWLRSEEHTSELQSLMRISYAVFCLTKKKSTQMTQTQIKIPHEI